MVIFDIEAFKEEEHLSDNCDFLKVQPRGKLPYIQVTVQENYL